MSRKRKTLEFVGVCVLAVFTLAMRIGEALFCDPEDVAKSKHADFEMERVRQARALSKR